MSVSSAPPKITRRTATKLLGGTLLSTLAPSSLAHAQPTAATAQSAYTRLLSDEDLIFLEDMERSAITEPSVVACVVGVIKKIQFAASPGGYETKAFYPFKFTPRGSQGQGGSGGTP